MGFFLRKTNSKAREWKKDAVLKYSRARTKLQTYILSTINKIANFTKVQYLVTNIAYVSGVIPIKYVYQQANFVNIDGKLQFYRYWITICLSTIVKCCFFSHFIRDYLTDNLKMPNHLEFTRVAMVYGLMFLGFLDYHTMWKSKEIVSSVNKTNQFLEQVSSKWLV